MEELILVDKNDNELGFANKRECHNPKPKLHRAFSIFIFNDKGEIMITKRSFLKDTWPGFWSNACCSHPRKGEGVEEAAKRRLKEELGISTPLTYLFKFEYMATFNKEWGEHEIDYVFIGRFNGNIVPNKDEIDDWKFLSVDELKNDILKHPDKYTPWFKLCVSRVIDFAENNNF